MSLARTTLVLICLAGPTLGLTAQSSIDPAKAEAAFAEALQLSTKDNGKLWGQQLYGPILFVLPSTRAVIANQQDANGQLRQQGNVFTGVLPKDVIIANTAVDWSGTRWTMVMWPLPQSSAPRQRLLAHELFHRIQNDLGIPAASPENAQLDTLEGRIWLQLEWRALAAALIGSGTAQTQSISDAIAFAALRHQLFSGSAESERSLELNEGLAEYTGLAASAPDAASARWRAIARLTNPEGETFVRSFAYTSGPAYGLLLDERLPGWRRRVGAKTDLATLLASSVRNPSNTSEQLRGLRYGASALRDSETTRAQIADVNKAKYGQLLVEGPTLSLPNAGKFSFGFDPGGLVPLDGLGTIYPAMQASDAWGTLEVREGALLSSSFQSLKVTAPTVTDEPHLKGPGWTLELAQGWHMVPAPRRGDFTLKRD